MEIKYFRLIKTIAEEGNIANSSDKLFLTQSALSHQLKELEEQLGFKVFLRNRNKWKLTDEGEQLYELGNSVLDSIQIGFDKIKNIRERSKGIIRLSMECYSFYQGVSSFMQQLSLLYPEIKVHLILEATHQPVSKLISEEIDAALVTTKPEMDDLISIPIFQDEIYTVMHREHESAAKSHLEAGDFQNEHLVIHSLPLETVSVYEHFLKPNKVVPAKITAIPLTEVALELVSSNQGIMCLPKWALKAFNFSEELVFKRLGVNGLKRTHYLIFRAADQDKKYMQDFIENFKESFQDKGCELVS